MINYIAESGDDQSPDQLDRVLQGLGRRLTSHPEDKEICFAVMLRLDMKRIMSMEGPQRSLAIVKQLQYIPRSFIWHESPSLDVPGFTWLPKEILATTGGVSELGLKLTDERLLVVGEGIVFRGWTHYMDRKGPHIRDAVSGKWFSLRWAQGEAFTGENVKSDSRWTVLAAIPQTQVMRKPIREAVVLRLDCHLDSAAPSELLERTAKLGTIAGQFVGRTKIEEIDEADTAYLKSKTGVKHDQLAEFRQAIDSGEEKLEDASEAVRRLYKEEGDDSWYIFDGQMQSQQRKWLVT